MTDPAKYEAPKGLPIIRYDVPVAETQKEEQPILPITGEQLDVCVVPVNQKIDRRIVDEHGKRTDIIRPSFT